MKRKALTCRQTIGVFQRIWNTVCNVYQELNPGTLSGAIDVIVVRQKDNTFTCGPFYVKFGKLGILNPTDQQVDIYINGNCVTDLHMRLGTNGEAFFVEELGENEDVTEDCHYHRRSMVRHSGVFCGMMRRSTSDGRIVSRSDTISKRTRLSYSESQTQVKRESFIQSFQQTLSDKEQICLDSVEDDTIHEDIFINIKEEAMEERMARMRMHSTLSPDDADRYGPSFRDTFSATRGQSSHNNQNEGETSGNTAHLRHHPNSCNQYSKCYKRVNRLTSERITQLNLSDGHNHVEYRIATRWQGTAYCEAAIYLWNYYDKLVISDVDGTITRSDVLGHVFSFVGKDWSHDGISQLYNLIHKNGYHFVYLTARAICQSHSTRQYLTTLEQEDTRLPKGPILLSPNSLFDAFHREMIEGRPEVFKIQCLQDLRHLFPEMGNPFYSGFGNRPSDVATYNTIGIPGCRIFTVSPDSSVHNERMHLKKTNFKQLCELVDFCFPLLNRGVPLRLGMDELHDFSIESEGNKDSTNYRSPNAESGNSFWNLEMSNQNAQLNEQDQMKRSSSDSAQICPPSGFQ